MIDAVGVPNNYILVGLTISTTLMWIDLFILKLGLQTIHKKIADYPLGSHDELFFS